MGVAVGIGVDVEVGVAAETAMAWGRSRLGSVRKFA